MKDISFCHLQTQVSYIQEASPSYPVIATGIQSSASSCRAPMATLADEMP